MKQYQNIPVTLVMAVILVGALSFVMPKNIEKYLGDRFWTQKTFAPSHYDVVFMGDSRVYRGISPAVIEQMLPGLKILNFGYSNGGLNKTMFDAAEKKLSPESSRKIMVIGVSANCLTAFTEKNDQYLKEKNRSREDVFERLYLNGILYHFSATSPENLKDKFMHKPSRAFYRNNYFSDGYVRSEKFPVDTMEAIASYIQDFTNYKVEERFIEELAIEVKEWSKRGIKVIGFRPPTTVPMRDLEDTMGNYNEAFIKTKFTEAGGHWVDLNTSQFKTYDGSHLDKESAIKLSEAIATKIKGFYH